MTDSLIQIHDRYFKPMISHNEIIRKVESIALEINNLNCKHPVFISVLNGSFMFTSDLCKYITLQPKICFIKIASYEGIESTGAIKELIGITEDLKDKDVFIIEDIIDTGNTLEYLYNHILKEKPKKIYTISLLFKPEAYKREISVNFVGFKIPNNFVIGYGMDYNELGRNLQDIYTLAH